MKTEVALEQRSGERVCVLWWMDLTTCDVSTSMGALICQIHAIKINHFVHNGPEIRIRCGGWRRRLYAKIKIMFLNGQWIENLHE